MSELIITNQRCQGWTNPGSLSYPPQITSLSGYYSPAGSSTVVSINGLNFYSYSVIRFGTFSPTVYFINSNVLQFYVPSSLFSGTFPVQVFNGSYGSNVVNYTIDNASGYWILNSNGSISNSNSSTTSIVSVGALSRGVPTTITEANNPYVIPNNVNWIIANGSADIFVTLPAGTQYNGREIMMKSVNTSNVFSTSINVSSLDGTTVTDTVMPASSLGKWVTMVYDGSNWVIMQGN